MLFHVPKLFISLWYILRNFLMLAWGTSKWRCLGGSLVLEKRRRSLGPHLLNYSEAPGYQELHLYFVMYLLGALFSGCSLPSIRIFRIISIFSSVQFSRSVLSDFLRPHESQHVRPPCPSPTPGVHSNSHPSSQWCHPAISSCRPLLLLPPIPPSIRVFSNESTLHEVAKVLELQL